MSINQNKNSFAVFGLLFGAITWGIIWYPYRLLAEVGFHGVSSSLVTYLIAALIGVVVFNKHLHGVFSRSKNIVWLIIAAGWTNLSYVLAVIEGEVMRVMLLFYLSPIWTLLLAHFWLKETASVKNAIVIFGSLLGAFIMLYDSSHPSNLPLPQNQSEWLALSSGVGFSFTNVITRQSDHLSLYAKSFAVWIGVVLMALAAALFFGGEFTMPTTFVISDWLLITLVALMLFASTLLVQYGVTHIAATRAAIIFIFELVVAAIAAYYLANEVMTINEWVGGALIVMAAVYAAISDGG